MSVVNAQSPAEKVSAAESVDRAEKPCAQPSGRTPLADIRAAVDGGWFLASDSLVSELVDRVEAAEAIASRARSVLGLSLSELGAGHNGHEAAGGEPECPGCWIQTLRNIVEGIDA